MSASDDKTYWVGLSEFYSPMRRLFTEPRDDGVERAECDYCMKLVPSQSMIPNPQYRPICLCCVVRCAYLAPVGEDEEDLPVRPAYARQLLDESDFGRRRVVPMEDVEEVELEDPETGRIFGSVDLHRPTGREIVWDADSHPRVCMTCPSGGGLCWLCESLRRHEVGLGDPLHSPGYRIFSEEDLTLLRQYIDIP